MDLFRRLQLDNLLSIANMAYDHYCPSIQDELSKRTYPVCSLYHPAIVTMKRHQNLHSAKYLLKPWGVKLQDRSRVQLVNRCDSDEESDQDHNAFTRTIDSHGNAPLINNIFDFLPSDFVEV